ncbi:protein-L-isoaspartate(D-aspartate) O-methyltransferase [Actinomadura craniellae]|uniref:Protein-L-isoaspartate O-methyltransferase n=1 Tax=Actinomadura craniellae TaxID=2231787 RepID=A0A365HEQ7_9ACTN|nr:methyltransferase domain-containing protein [Actinomadura craniellae]RAY16683.1 protein-L-isoaspartate(D-aspartate) O-methyltransferase [Actinomadura craniellae]
MKPADIRRAVPREAFVPDTIWVRRADGWAVPLSRRDAPREWERIVAADDEPVITQVDDGATGKGTWPTSSGSSPEVMAIMLDALQVRPGLRVLEIGTGTGYNAAVLATIAGPRNVTTLEIDATIAEQARTALDRAGHPVHLVVADATHGYPPHAPYDRIIVTAAAHHIPYAWIRQTEPGGLIVVPWAPTFHPDWPLCRLTVHPDGTATGRFIGPSSFMPLRGQRLPQSVIHDTEQRWADAGEPDCTRYGITVTAQEQQIWLDTPDTVIA